MKKTTKVVLGSAMTMAMCASLIAGSTLALFSSEADVNVAITSGKVDLTATVDKVTGYSAVWDETAGDYVDSDALTTAFTNGGTFGYSAGMLTLNEISPGDAVEFDLKITNTSTIKIQYRVQLTVPQTDDEGNAVNTDALVKALEVTFGEDGTPVTIGSYTTIAQKWVKEVEPGDPIDPVHVRIELPWETGNTYQGQSCQLKVGVYAIQSNAHVTDPTDGALTIYNDIDLLNFSTEVNSGTTFEGQIVELAGDIYLGDATKAIRAARRSAYVLADTVSTSVTTKEWKPIGDSEHAFSGTFEGHGYTIYGLNAKGANAGLFGVTENATIQNVNLANATVEATEANGTAGALVAEAKGNLTVTNVSVTDSTVKAAEGVEATVGALVGTTTGEGATVTVTDVDVQMNESDSELSSGNALVGGGEGQVEYTGDKNELRYEPVEGFVEIVKLGTEEKPYYEISTAAGLTYFAKSVNGTTGEDATAKDYKGLTVTLTKDIDLKNEEWMPIGGTKLHGVWTKFLGTFDGGDKTIKNLVLLDGEQAVITDKREATRYLGLFGAVSGATIKNFTIENVKTKNAIYKHGECTKNDFTEGHGAILSAFAGSAIGVAFDSEISNITVKGKIEIAGSQYVGGIVGRIETPSTVENCVVDGGAQDTSYVWSTEMYVGGIVGHAADGNDSTLKGNVVKNITIVDDFWLLYHPDQNQGVADNYALHGGIGGIAGIVGANSTIENNEVTNVVIQTNWISNEGQNYIERVGVISGSYSGTASTFEGNIAKDNVIVNTVNGELFNGGVVGNQFDDKNVHGVATSYPTLHNNEIDITWRGVGHYYKDGETTQNYWYVNSADMLKALAYMTNGDKEYPVPEGVYTQGTTKEIFPHNFANETVILVGDVDLQNEEWTPIGTPDNSFRGTFNGAGHTVTYHVQVNDPEPTYYGLFGYIDNHATIEDVTVAGSVTMTGNSVGQSDKSKMIRIGGIVGCIGSEGGTVQNCISLVDFDFSKLITHWYVGGYAMNFGGIVGDAAFATLENLLFAGNVTLNEDMYEEDGKIYPTLMQWSQAASNIGGIAGNVLSSVTISKCLNLGQRYFKGINGGAAAGGIAGRYSSSVSFLNNMTECYSFRVRTIGYDAGKTPTGAPGENDAITEALTSENWATLCDALSVAGWTWNATYNCPVPAMNV